MKRTQSVAGRVGLSVGVLASVFALSSSALALTPSQIVLDANQVGPILPLIVAGEAAGTPPDTPANHVDPNTIASPFAGVGSIFIDAGGANQFLCTAFAIHGFSQGKQMVRNYILTAAHCVDFAGGLDQDNNVTGDGVVDVAPQNVSFYLNFGGDQTHTLIAAEITLHPDWHGFLNASGPEGASANDDLALIRLASPLPAGVPTYNLATVDSGDVVGITAVGYGETGSPSGYLSPSATFTTKRIGKNRADSLFDGDESITPAELFSADFDGPTSATNVWDVGLAGFDPAVEGTIGNDMESTIGPGDSGSPSFLSDFSTLDLLVGIDGQPIAYGLNTFSSTNSPEFGSFWGGVRIPTYATWIDGQIVPEPGSIALLILGWAACAAHARRMRRA